MNLYRQSIILFGMVVPILIGLIVVGIGFKVKSNMEQKYASKLQALTKHKQEKIAAADIEMEIERQREHLNRWIEQSSQETASILSNHLKEISENLPNKEIQQTSFDPLNSAGDFGQGSKQKSSRISMSFRGTYRSLQRAFLELETRMPQLQLEELKMTPMTNNAALVTFQVSYTAWEN